MDIFGSFALVLAFVCAVYAFGGGIAAIFTRHRSTPQALTVILGARVPLWAATVVADAVAARSHNGAMPLAE